MDGGLEMFFEWLAILIRIEPVCQDLSGTFHIFYFFLGRASDSTGHPSVPDIRASGRASLDFWAKSTSKHKKSPTECAG